MLQRDYWAVLKAPRTNAKGVASTLLRHFETFSPPELARFSRDQDGQGPLTVGDEIRVDISYAGSFRVRVVHTSCLSLTLATLDGHPEAGRITFGVYPNAEDDIVVHIRSRARSGSNLFKLGYRAAGEPMQATTWSRFIDGLAAAVADGVRDVIHVETREVQETEADRSAQIVEPTFRAVDSAQSGS